MKKVLLTQVIFLMSFVVFGQKTATSYTSTFAGSLATNGSGGVDGGAGFGWYTDDDAVIQISQNNELVVTSTSAAQYQGFGGYTYDDGSGINAVDVSTSPKLQFKIKASADISLQIALQDLSGGSTLYYTLDLTASSSYQTVTIDYSSMSDDEDLTTIQGPRFQLNNASAYTGVISIDDLYLGTTVTGLKAASFVTESTIFPNPSAGLTSASFTLKESAKVKVVLMDITGKELAVVLDETASAGLNEVSFNVSSYNKGIYYLNYFINDEPAVVKALVVN